MTHQRTVATPDERIINRIMTMHNEKVMLERNPAELYDVRPIALWQQVKRNRKRFPPDCMFQLTPDEVERWVSQQVIPSRRSLGADAVCLYRAGRGHALTCAQQ